MTPVSSGPQTERTVYLNRRARRKAVRRAGLPWDQIAQYNGPVVRVIRHLMYWKGLTAFGETPTFHVFSHCRRLAAEWAGRVSLQPRYRNSPNGIGPVCPDCAAGVRQGRTA